MKNGIDMKGKKMKKVSGFIIIMFVCSFVLAPWGRPIAAAVKEEVTTLVIQVHEKGFSDASGKRIEGIIPIPKTSTVKIVFEYADANEEEHEFAVMLPYEEEVYSDLLSPKNRRVEISFVTGKAGERYEVYCIMDCEAMDNLVDLFLVTHSGMLGNPRF